MKKVVSVIGVIVCIFFAFANFSQIDTREEYIEACLYIMDTRDQKSQCYDVYPENHSSNAILWGVVSIVGVIVFATMLAANKKNYSHNDQH